MKKLIPVYILVLGAFVCAAVFGSRAVTASTELSRLRARRCIVIDAGHGGEDGGAVSCTGVNESGINLQIALRLEKLLNLLGYDTKMIRFTDTAVYTQGNTIAEKKVSDLKQRVKLVNETENALLVSIHQNQFSDSRYSGAQVFYAGDPESKELAVRLQTALVQTLNPDSNRKAKASSGVYLMEKITCSGILVECGFLSNYAEEARLQTPEYQKSLCCAIAATLGTFLEGA